MRYEAGITNTQYPYDPRWTGILVDAETPEQAENLFIEKGFYRNLVVRASGEER